MGRVIIWIVLGLIFPQLLYAANGTTPGSLTVAPAFQSLSVTAAFTGDDNANATASIQYRVTGFTPWHNAYTPYIDRRATVEGSENPYTYQARVSIVGLTANTSYDVQVTWSDVDGVTGTNPVTTTVTTLTDTPPTGGSTLTVNDNTELANALSSVIAGQTIHLNSGTYNAFTMSQSGNSSAWIKVQGELDGSTIISGAGVTQNVLINADYIILEYVTLSASDFSGVITSSGKQHILIQHVTMQDVSYLCADDPTGTHYGDCGVDIRGDNTYVVSNTILTNINSRNCIAAPSYEGPGMGVSHGNKANIVIANNVITGGFRDAIGGGGSGTGIANIDVHDNTLTGFKDDAIEIDGDDSNVRVWGNVITIDNGNDAISASPSRYGPFYIFRNVIRTTVDNCKQIYKVSSDIDQPIYLFHNSLDNPSSCSWDSVAGGRGIIYNNIFRNRGSMYLNMFSNTITDYNVYQRIGTAYYAYNWGGTTHYDSFSDYQTGTGQDPHGVESNPLYIDTALHIGVNSPAYDAGVVLDNFNSLDSAWPYEGAAPDIGAYEWRNPVHTMAPSLSGAILLGR